MSRKAKTPFATKPPSQYKKPEFYWRGGNTFREKEYVSDEYLKALANLHSAEKAYEKTEKEFNEKSAVLSERTGYSEALASYLDADSSTSSESNKKKQELTKLEGEINDLELELTHLQQTQQPAVSSSLQKEKAFILLECQQGYKSLDIATEEIDTCKVQLAACQVNPKYRSALALEFQIDKLLKKKRYLRALVTRSKEDFDKAERVIPVQNEQSRLMRHSYQSLIETKLAIKIGEEKINRRKTKHKAELAFLIDQIEVLNYRLEDLGLEDDVIDVDALRTKYLDNSESKEEEENLDTEIEPENEEGESNIEEDN